MKDNIILYKVPIQIDFCTDYEWSLRILITVMSMVRILESSNFPSLISSSFLPIQYLIFTSPQQMTKLSSIENSGANKLYRVGSLDIMKIDTFTLYS
jgi:hypothetical protein